MSGSLLFDCSVVVLAGKSMGSASLSMASSDILFYPFADVKSIFLTGRCSTDFKYEGITQLH